MGITEPKAFVNGRNKSTKQNPNHYEIAPRQAMTPERYQGLLNQVKLTRVPK